MAQDLSHYEGNEKMAQTSDCSVTGVSSAFIDMRKHGSSRRAEIQLLGGIHV